MSDSFRRHQQFAAVVRKGLESSQKSRFENSGTSMRIAGVVESWLRTEDGQRWLEEGGMVRSAQTPSPPV